jgi:hypothetical protein
MIAITAIVIILIIYIYLIKLRHPDYKVVVYNDIKDKVKSGDMIMFSALDGVNQIFMGSYYTHVGVIYRESPEATPKLIESFNPYRMPFFPKSASKGIISCDLEHRMNTYRGYVLYKELQKPISQKANIDFKEFIEYAETNMRYDKNVIIGEIGKIIFNTPFSTETNCGQFTALILIKLGLISLSNFRNRQRHHLRYVCALDKLKNNSYKSPVYIYSEYFR